MAMSSRFRTTIEVILLAVVVAFLVAIALGIFVDLFWASGTKPSEAFRGAFLGAFFAFLFVRIGDALTRIHDRKAKGRQALVALQHRFLEVLNIVHDDLFVFQKLAEFREHLKKSPPVPVLMNRFVMLPQLGDLLPLNNIDLVNELMSLNVEIRKMNESMETWERSYESIKSAFINKAMDEKTYLYNAAEGCNESSMLAAFLKALQDDLIDSFAAVRLLADSDTFLGKVIGWTIHRTYPKNFDVLRSAERSKILSEVAEARRSNVRALRGQISQDHRAGT